MDFLETFLFSETDNKYNGPIPWENTTVSTMYWFYPLWLNQEREYYKSSYPKISCPQEIHFYPQQKNCYIDTRIPYNLMYCSIPQCWIILIGSFDTWITKNPLTNPSLIDLPISQTILWPISPPMDYPGSQCHLSPGTYGLWYHLSHPSLLVPKGQCCDMPLVNNFLLRIIPSIK